MSNLYRGPSIDASYQVSVHLAKIFGLLALEYEGVRKFTSFKIGKML